MTREAFETALDAGLLQIKKVISRTRYRRNLHKPITEWYTCRRNGKTQTWNKDPSRFEIPIKYSFKDTVRVKSEHFYRGEVDTWFRILLPEGITVVGLNDPSTLHNTLKEVFGE